MDSRPHGDVVRWEKNNTLSAFFLGWLFPLLSVSWMFSELMEGMQQFYVTAILEADFHRVSKQGWSINLLWTFCSSLSVV